MTQNDLGQVRDLAGSIMSRGRHHECKRIDAVKCHHCFGRPGGERRMAQLVRLIGSEALRLKAGDSKAGEVLAVALRETEGPDFPTKDRDALYSVLDAKVSSDIAPSHAAARALLRSGTLFQQWRGLRRLAIRQKVIGTILSAVGERRSPPPSSVSAFWRRYILRTPLQDLRLPLAATETLYVLRTSRIGAVCAVTATFVATPLIRSK